MNEKLTCEEFSDRLGDLVKGRLGAEETAAMKAHLGSCRDCADIYEIKMTLMSDPADVPAEVEEALVSKVVSDLAAAREMGNPRRSWASRYLMPAMAAAIVIFVFLTGYMLIVPPFLI